MFIFLRKLFCLHRVSTEICKIHYLPDSTELIYTKLCKRCGKKLGKSVIKHVGKNEKEQRS